MHRKCSGLWNATVVSGKPIGSLAMLSPTYNTYLLIGRGSQATWL
uniref:Uncharacterized protein n=1 Tax=Rhizophora mucronata TaxID=61149 RepID=A0A2P2MYT1_RHIMU